MYYQGGGQAVGMPGCRPEIIREAPGFARGDTGVGRGDLGVSLLIL